MCHLHQGIVLRSIPLTMHGTKMKLNNFKNTRYATNASRAEPEHGVMMSLMFVQYASVLELLQSPTSPNYGDSKENFKETKCSFS
jgi:hypothetical protein